MKNTFQKSFIVIMALVMLFCGNALALANGTKIAAEPVTYEFDVSISKEMTGRIPENQILDYELMCQAEKYMLQFDGQAHAMNSRAADDNYGGIYYDNGEYILLFKQQASTKMVLEDGFRVETCKFSLNELYSTQEAVMKNVEQNAKGCFNTAIDVLNNVTLVRSDIMEEAEVMALLKYTGINLDMIRFEKLSGEIVPTASINAGGASRNIGRGSNSSASAGVRSTQYGNGYIVQGHDVIIGENFGTTSGTIMGKATARCQPVLSGSREADATFVLLNSGHSFNNTVEQLGGSYRVLRSGTTASLAVNSPVYMSGSATSSATNDYSSGTVRYLRSNYSWSDRDGRTHNYVAVEATYPSLSGDSGGCVWTYTTSGPIWAGVQSYGGATYNGSGFAAAYDVVSSLGVSVY